MDDGNRELGMTLERLHAAEAELAEERAARQAATHALAHATQWQYTGPTGTRLVVRAGPVWRVRPLVGPPGEDHEDYVDGEAARRRARRLAGLEET